MTINQIEERLRKLEEYRKQVIQEDFEAKTTLMLTMSALESILMEKKELERLMKELKNVS